VLENGGTSAKGASVERRRREVEALRAPRCVVYKEGCHPPHWGGCAPSPEKFSISELKKVSFGAFWVLLLQLK